MSAPPDAMVIAFLAGVAAGCYDRHMPDSSAATADPAEVEKAWREQVKRLLKRELKGQSLTYEEVAKRLQAIGVEETEVSIRNKISRGTFPATFLLQFMHVLGVRLVPVSPTTGTEVVLPPELIAAMPKVGMTPELWAAITGRKPE